jgi:hypothetical protein
MAPAKAKQVGSFAQSFAKKAMKRPAAVVDEDREDAELDHDQDAEVVAMKKPAAAMKRPAAAFAENCEDEEADDDQDAQAIAMKKPAAAAPKKRRKDSADASSNVKAKEEELIANRTKELKTMPVPDLKELVKSKGLQTGLKTEMIDSILSLEAKDRDQARAHAAKVKEVEANIKAEFESKTRPDLMELCAEKGLKKGGSKDELVERLFGHAKMGGQVDQVMAGLARDARRQELTSLDKGDLYELCEKKGVDPFNKEVMVERLLAVESLSRVPTSKS